MFVLLSLLLSLINVYHVLSTSANADFQFTDGGRFGSSARVSGDWAIVGSDLITQTHATLYHRVGSTWSYHSNLQGDATTDLNSYSDCRPASVVDINGDWALVSGAARNTRIYQQSGGTWTLFGTVSSSNSIPNSIREINSGQSAAISGNGERTIVGLPQLTSSQLVIFHKQTSAYNDVAYYENGDGSNQHMGASVGISFDGNVAAGCGSAETAGQAICRILLYDDTRPHSPPTFKWYIANQIKTPPAGSGASSATGFGNALAVSDDGTDVFIAQSTEQMVYRYQRSGNSWAHAQTLSITAFSLDMSGGRLAVGVPSATGTCGAVHVFYKDGAGNYLLQEVVVDQGGASCVEDGLGRSVSLSGNTLFATAMGNVGRALVWEPIDGLPTMAPTQSPIPPTLQPTAAPTPNPRVSVGTVFATLAFANTTASQEAANDLILDVKAQYPDTEHVVSGTDTITIPASATTGVTDQELIDAIKASRNLTDCTITLSSSTARLRELNTVITAEITFSLDEVAFNELQTNGNTLESQAFLDALAADLGVNSTDLNLSVVGSEVVVEITLIAIASQTTPLDATTVQQLSDIKTYSSVAANTIVSEIGGGVAFVAEVDLCELRTCSGRGEYTVGITTVEGCVIETGVCQCIGEWWGINCETACSCESGGVCNGAYCQCVYPSYGTRCEQTLDCTC